MSQEQEIDRSADRQGVQIFRKTDEAPAVADEAIKAGARGALATLGIRGH